jgi:hypothetical protein
LGEGGKLKIQIVTSLKVRKCFCGCDMVQRVWHPHTPLGNLYKKSLHPSNKPTTVKISREGKMRNRGSSNGEK